ncbi:MAG: PAS domain-containing sensor histidine kinase [Anaerolineae bacterium]|nr:PAS domain-containing sensor histidine kinase [Anaerolineae bacterium]
MQENATQQNLELAALRRRVAELEALEAEHKQVEEALRESEELYRTLVEISPDAITLTDLDGKILFCNQQAALLNGCNNPEELVGRNSFEFIAPEDRPRAIDNALKALQGVPLKNIEYTVLKEDGTRFLAELNTALVTDAEGRARGFIGAMHDITHHKEVEEALRQSNAELQAQKDDLDAFAHTVAHDLQSPLAFIIGMAELLADEGETVPLAEQQRYLQAIVQHGLKVSRITEELLLLAQVRRGAVKLEPLDMARIVAEAWQRLAEVAQDYKAEISLPGAWPTALGHGPWVEEVWVNYLSNALKYGGRPPHLELGAAVQSDDQVRFWVHDNGPGLTEEKQSRLFIPFTQIAQARATGYGLGLSIVHRIVEKLGGQVGVESDGVNGTTFSFTLPGAPEGKPDPF